MSADDYNFDLRLKWHRGPPKKVSVTYVSDQEEIPGDPNPYSDVYVADSDSKLHSLMSNANRLWSDSDLEKAGQEVADLLLPKKGEIRNRFRTFCRENDRVRLRLLYPKRPKRSDFPSEADWSKQKEDWKEQLDELLNIPWEYAYLPESDDDDTQKGRCLGFLGIQKNISIVHCVEEPPPDSAPPAGVDRLKVNMAYLSALEMSREKNLNKLEEELIKRLANALGNTVLNDAQKLEREEGVRKEFREARDHYTEILKGPPTELERALRWLQAFADTLRNLLETGDIIADNTIGDITENYKADLEKFQEDESLLQGYDKAFQDFVEELRDNVLQALIICPNISGNRQPPAEPGDVTRALEHSDLVHVICHGSPNDIKLKEETLDREQLLVTYFQSLLDEDKALPDELKGLKAVLLVSCHSADGSGSIAHTLHQLGVPMVVGMTGRIDVLPATNFVDGFYEAIADGSVEQAVASGRLVMFQNKSGGQRHGGFGLPRLYLYSKDSTLIPRDILCPGEGIWTECFDSHRGNILTEAGLLGGPGRWASDIDKIQQWINKDEGTWYYVSGPSGSGKSTLIARLIEDLKQGDKRKYLYHFCSEDCPGSSHRLNFVCSLVSQLMKCFGKDCCDWCHPDAEDRRATFPLLVNNADDALIDFVIEPLCRVLDEENRKALESGNPAPPLPVTIIDGLDTPSEDDSVLGLLIRHRDALGAVTRFVITADEESEADRLIRDRLTQRGKPDHSIEPPGPDQPMPMYIHFKKSLDEQGVSLELEDELSLPLNALYQSYLDHVWETSDERQEIGIRKLLQVLSLAHEPLRQDFAARIIGLPPDMPELVRQIRPFLKGPSGLDLYQQYEHLQVAQYEITPPLLAREAGNQLLTLDHISIKCFLMDTLLREDAEKANAHGLFVEAYRPPGGWNEISDWSNLPGSVGLTLVERLSDSGPGGLGPSLGEPTEVPELARTTSSKEATRYAWLYLADHAYASWCLTTETADGVTRHKRAKDFLDLICNPGFRTVRLANIGQQTALEDVRRGLYVVITEYFSTLRNNLRFSKFLSVLEPILESLPILQFKLDDLRASFDHISSAFERIFAAMVNDESTALTALERKLRRENGGVPALLEFLGLPMEPLGWSRSNQ